MNYRMQESAWDGGTGATSQAAGDNREREQKRARAETVLKATAEREDWTPARLDAALAQVTVQLEVLPQPWQPDENPSWSSAQPRLFYQIRDLLLQESELELGSDAASRALNAYGERFYTENGRHPTWTDVRTDPEALVEMQRSALRTDLLPTVFTVATPEGVVVYENTTAKGPLPVPIAKQADMQRYLLEQTSAAASGEGSPIAMQAYQSFNQLPVYTPEELGSLIDYAAVGQQSSGGGSRARLRFDPDQLAEAARERWRTVLREEPGDPYGLANEFIGVANQTFSAGNAAADFDTWILNRMRREARYTTLYGHKGDTESELEYLDSYLQPVGQYGLRSSDANEQVIRGLSSGAAPSSFAQSLATTPDVVALGQGPFSQRFARTISQLGPLQGA